MSRGLKRAPTTFGAALVFSPTQLPSCSLLVRFSRFGYPAHHRHQQDNSRIFGLSRHSTGSGPFYSSLATAPAAVQATGAPSTPAMKTRIVKVNSTQGDDDSLFGRWATTTDNKHEKATTSPTVTDDISHRQTWEVPSSPSSSSSVLAPLEEAAAYLRASDIPVAFPTETVYGLGADATRSAAVRGIYAAKGRPSDNPLIVHVADLDMLRSLLTPSTSDDDPIPAIYHPLIRRFWPGPLTILLPNPSPSPLSSSSPVLRLAPEVTATLPTFGARLPSSPLARSLIKLVARPLAAPSANASTKPSPTTAQHVLDDLDGRIELILDGGSCEVGVESTVVDGLCDPPVVLRPGGVSMEQLKGCKGWEGVEKAYKDQAELGGEGKGGMGPRAPGMKYKHYSPRARVVLFEAKGSGEGVGRGNLEKALMVGDGEKRRTIAVIRTVRWPVAGGLRSSGLEEAAININGGSDSSLVVREGELLGEDDGQSLARLLDVDLGRDVRGVAHGLFAALRELDRRGADVIFVEGVSDGDDIAAAVMNRLRKAASEIRA